MQQGDLSTVLPVGGSTPPLMRCPSAWCTHPADTAAAANYLVLAFDRQWAVRELVGECGRRCTGVHALSTSFILLSSSGCLVLFSCCFYVWVPVHASLPSCAV